MTRTKSRTRKIKNTLSSKSKRLLPSKKDSVLLFTRNNSGFLSEQYPLYDSLYEAKTIQILFVLFAVISIVAYWYHQSNEEKLNLNKSSNNLMHPFSNNLQQGLLFCSIFIIGYFVTQSRDGVLIRPHPVVWRFVHGMSIIYVLVLLVMLPFRPQDMRESLRTLISPSLGNISINTNYGEDCQFNWSNFSSQFFEFFTLSHMVGYVIKALVYRDWILLFAHSILFEIIEISLAHLLPNFNECWWDHLILDVFGMNLIGSILGMKLVKMLETRTYSTRSGSTSGSETEKIDWINMISLQHLNGAKRKARRILLQFTPLTWDLDKWEFTHNSTHFLAALIAVCCGLSVETSIFFLRYFLWIEMSNRYIFVVMATKAALTAHAYRELYVYVAQDDPKNQNDDNDDNDDNDGNESGNEIIMDTAMEKKKQNENKNSDGSKEKMWTSTLLTKNFKKEKKRKRRPQRLGHNAWLCIILIVTEVTVCIKWSYDAQFDRPYPPRKVTVSWLLFIILGCFWFDRRYLKVKNDLCEKVLRICVVAPMIALLIDEIFRTLWYKSPGNKPMGRSYW